MENKTNMIAFSELITSVKTGLNPRGNFSLNCTNAIYSYITSNNLGLIQTVCRHNRSNECDKIDENAKNVIKEKTALEKGDILFPIITGGNRVPVLVLQDDINFGVSENVFVIKLKETVNREYVLYALRSDFVQRQIMQRTNHTTIKNINKNDLLNLVIPMPPIETQNQIATLMHKMDDLTTETQRLSKLQEQQSKHYNNILIQNILKGENKNEK